MSNSNNNAARRAFINLTKKASFIATLTATGFAFAQAPAAAKPADNKSQVKANVGQAAADTSADSEPMNMPSRSR